MLAWFCSIRNVTPAVLVSFAATQTLADPAVIKSAKAVQNGGNWTISVTLRHGDTGWDDYADGWRVIGPEGEVLGTRELVHPHEAEQPFTRSLSGVTIPEGITAVEIEARTSTGGWEGARFPLTLPR
jgi:hypothetical protein